MRNIDFSELFKDLIENNLIVEFMQQKKAAKVFVKVRWKYRSKFYFFF